MCSRPDSLPFPLGFPSEGLSRDIGGWLMQGVAYSSPGTLLNISFYRFLFCSLPQFFIADLIKPPYAEDLPQAINDECLDPLGHCYGGSPCLGSI